MEQIVESFHIAGIMFITMVIVTTKILSGAWSVNFLLFWKIRACSRFISQLADGYSQVDADCKH